VENTNGGLPNDWVYGLVKDERDDTIWMGTEGGLAHFDGKKWENWDHKDGQGAPYELLKSDLEQKIDPSKASKHHADMSAESGMGNLDKSFYNPNYIVSLDMDSKGRIWVGTWGGGLSVMENGKYIRTYTTHDGLPGNHIFLVKEGPQGNIWIGTNEGLSKFDGKVFKNYSAKDGLVNKNVFSISFEKDASLWVGSYQGLAFIKGGLQ
jgi:ligand-binding sensor domain-containing protein